MSATQTSDAGSKHDGGSITVKVNRKDVTLPKHRVTGIEVKEAAITQGVEIELDFHLTLEAEKGEPARRIKDKEEVEVDKQSRFRCNDGDDDS